MHGLSRRFIGFALLVSLLGLFVVAAPVSAGQSDANHDYAATLSSGDEVPLTDTGTYGWAMLHINADGQSMSYTLWVNAIDNPVAAHIHVGGMGVSGPVVVALYSGKNVGPFGGVLSSGTITAQNLDGPLKGKTMDDLFAAMKSGGAYVNVHTEKHPGGETRGQIYSDDNGRLGG
ncbi:MAG: CHRD domain-containing protein [Thermomicrobia bacterium]|nr:CHRD domain-containing protein [Thermomicrobia bacterium]